MALTAQETVTMFMRYVHTEDDPIRAAAETVAARRREVVSGAPDREPRNDEVAVSARVSPVAIVPQGSAGSRVPVRRGPTKTAIATIVPAAVGVTKAEPPHRNPPPGLPISRRSSKSDSRDPDARWPTAEIMRRARHVDDTDLTFFADTEAAGPLPRA